MFLKSNAEMRRIRSQYLKRRKIKRLSISGIEKENGAGGNKNIIKEVI